MYLRIFINTLSTAAVINYEFCYRIIEFDEFKRIGKEVIMAYITVSPQQKGSLRIALFDVVCYC
jgi:hypothetical protein